MAPPTFTRTYRVCALPGLDFLLGSALYRVSWKTLLALDRESDEFPQLANHLLAELRSRDSEDFRLTEEQGFRLIELIDTLVCVHS